MALTPNVATNLSGGGAYIGGPVKWNGSTLTGLSYLTQYNPDGVLPWEFTGCYEWHNHLWFWGSPQQPDYLFATDIDTAEGFSFMVENGGYPIGVGDGDPYIQDCFAIGNIMYVFKSNSIYAVTGYDFQPGEYQFQVAPAISGSGVPARCCIQELNNALVYWSGAKFERLAVGSFQTEYIGAPIKTTSGKVAIGTPGFPNLVRAVAGNYQVLTHLNGAYPSPGPVTDSELRTNMALWAVDVGNGVADTVLAYDDDATQVIQQYAWAPWVGWQVAAWMRFTGGLNNAGNAFDQKLLFYIPPPPVGGLLTINQIGADAGADNGTAISWLAQTGWIDFDTPALLKHLHRIFLDLAATPGATIMVNVIATGNSQNGTPYAPRSFSFPVTAGTAAEETYQVLNVRVNPYMTGYKIMLTFSESGSETAYEVAGITLDYIEEAFKP
jgi:hypothetical protein